MDSCWVVYEHFHACINLLLRSTRLRLGRDQIFYGGVCAWIGKDSSNAFWSFPNLEDKNYNLVLLVDHNSS